MASTVLSPMSPVGGSNAEGFLLLTIEGCSAKSTSPQYPSVPSGLLSLECVTLVVHDPASHPERDVWLVLRVDPSSSTSPGLEYALPATQHILHSRNNYTYTLPLGNGQDITLTLPPAATEGLRQDYETLEVILAQYAVLQMIQPPPGSPPPPAYATGDNLTTSYDGFDGDLKGRLVLVDEDNGQVIGALPQSVAVHEDPSITQNVARGHEKDPVVIQIQDGPGGQGVFVHPLDVDESDFIMRTAGTLSRGVIFATNVVSTGMTKASSWYIAHSKPNDEPIVFSETTRKNVKRVHNISGKAVVVTKKTTNLIHQQLGNLIDKVAGRETHHHNVTPVGPPYSGVFPPTGPPLPPREKGAASYNSGAPPPLPPRSKKPRLLNRLLTSTDMLLTTVEHSAHHLVSHGTSSLAMSMRHKYGNDVGDSVQNVGESVRNVGVVYIDARGVGRRALLKTAGKRIIFGGKDGKQQEVVFGDTNSVHYRSAPGSGTNSPLPFGGPTAPQRQATAPPSFYSPPPGAPPSSTMPGTFPK